MLKTSIACLSLGALLCTSLLTGCGAQSTSTTQKTGSSQTQVQDADLISESEAKKAALDHAGLTEDEVTFTRATRDTDGGRQIWELEFVANGVEYDYDIDASTGEVISSDQDANRSNTTGTTTDTSLPSDTAISPEEAQAAALDHAGLGEADVTALRANLDYDDGRQIYDVEFFADGMEYSYEIDATTGTVLSYDIDRD